MQCELSISVSLSLSLLLSSLTSAPVCHIDTNFLIRMLQCSLMSVPDKVYNLFFNRRFCTGNPIQL